MRNQDKIVKTSVINNKEVEKKLKELEGKNRTADAEGKFILIKPMQSDRLASDFIVPNTQVSLRPPSSLTNDQLLSNPIVSKLKDKKDEYGIVSPTSNLVKDGDNKELLKKQTGVPKKKVTTINNRKFGDLGGQQSTTSVVKPEQLPIIPAGSSYEMIIPEEGVTIIEGKKKKGGTMNFLRAYNKHSKYDYMTILKETMGANSLRDTMEMLIGSTMKEDDKTRDQFTLPQIGFEKTNKEGNLTYSPSLKISSTQRKRRDSIKTSNKNIINLKNTMESLSLMDEKTNMAILYGKTETSNIFRDKTNKERLKDTLFSSGKTSNYNNTMNNFNQSIMTNNYWGTTQGLDPSQRRFNITMELLGGKKVYKPNIKEIEQELGKNLVQSKLPRARIKSEIKNPVTLFSKQRTGKKESFKSNNKKQIN